MDFTNATAAPDLIPHDGGRPGSPIRSAGDIAAAFLVGYAEATRVAYAGDLRAWGGWLDGRGVSPLDAHRVHVEVWTRSMEAAQLSPATIARRLAALAGFYDYAVDEGLIARSPVARVRRPSRSDESPRLGLDKDEIAGFLAAARESGARDHALACLLALNGLRISETLALDLSHLGTARGHRTISLARKGGRTQVAPLAPRTAEAIEALTRGQAAGPVFRTRTGRRMDRHAAQKVVRRLARAAGVAKTISPHSLRHSFVTAALDAGVALRDVQDAAGHADPRTTRRYDRGRHSLDRHATYAVAAAVA